MARKKKTTRKKGGGLLGFFSRKKKGRKGARRSSSPSTGLKITLSIVVLAVLAGGGAVGFMYMERYAKKPATEQPLPITLYSLEGEAQWTGKTKLRLLTMA